jgi:hypothetical protein
VATHSIFSYAVLTHFAPQSRAPDVQNSCRFGEISLAAGNGVDDELFFVLV